MSKCIIPEGEAWSHPSLLRLPRRRRWSLRTQTGACLPPGDTCPVATWCLHPSTHQFIFSFIHPFIHSHIRTDENTGKKYKKKGEAHVLLISADILAEWAHSSCQGPPTQACALRTRPPDTVHASWDFPCWRFYHTFASLTPVICSNTAVPLKTPR